MTINELTIYIRQNKQKLQSQGIEIKFIDDYFGDEYNSEQYYLFDFEVFGNKYSVGSVSVTEDNEDWAQAECYNYDICRENDNNVKPEKVFNLLDNFLQINRDKKIEEILEKNL